MADPKQCSEEEADDFLKLVRQKQTGRVSRMETLGIAQKSTPCFYLFSVPMRFTIEKSFATRSGKKRVALSASRTLSETAPAM